MAEVPYATDDDGRTVYDLDAYAAAQRESHAHSFIKVRGVELPLPTSSDMPLNIMDMIEAGDARKAFSGMFPGVDPDVLNDVGFTLGDVQVVIALIMGKEVDEVLGE